MKKIMFAVMAMCAIGFTACGNKAQTAEAPADEVEAVVYNAEEEAAASPFAEADKLPAIGKTLAGLKFVQAVDVMDCLGCGNCADVCPGKKGEKALTLRAVCGSSCLLRAFAREGPREQRTHLFPPRGIRARPGG